MAGHAVRWRLLTELADSDYRVRGLVTRVGQPQNLISYHMRLLRDGGLVAQSRRLGHNLGDRIQETYSNVAAEVEHRLLEALNDRWDKAVADNPDQPAWRI
jgi:DNA-binding transcriptional ArsR family regulator